MDALSKQTILVVDDTPENIMLLDGILSADYKVRAATNGEKALKIAESSSPPDLILLDVMMPDMDGFEVCRRLKKNRVTSRIPVIFITAMEDAQDETHGFELGAVDYIHKPIRGSLVRARVRIHLALYDQNRELELMVRERTAELNDTRLQVIRNLGRAGEFRDNETGMHVIRVSHYCRLLAEASAMHADDVELMFLASPMHDIGKIGIPDSVLLKPGKLDEGEFELMKTHTTIGADILGEHASPLLSMAREIALTHHEKWDGSGYPQGIGGEDIPLAGRITAVADVFDALTSRRPYKKAWPVEEATTWITSQSGGHFDPRLVNIFGQVLPQMLQCRDAYADPGEANVETDARS